MTVRRTSSRKPTASGCGASTTRPASTTTPRTPVSTGCGASGKSKGWTPAPAPKPKPRTSTVSERSQRLLDAAGPKTPAATGRKAASSGCGTSTPRRESIGTSCAPAPRPKPAPAPAPAPRRTTRSGC